MNQFDLTLVVLLCLLACGVLSQNHTITIATAVLIAVKILGLGQLAFPYFQQYGLTLGVIILTIGVLTPIAMGKIQPKDVLNTFLSLESIFAILVGIFATWLGARGLNLMSNQPHILTSLLVGTIIGVAFFRGLPIGPLVAAGLISLFYLGK